MERKGRMRYVLRVKLWAAGCRLLLLEFRPRVDVGTRAICRRILLTGTGQCWSTSDIVICWNHIARTVYNEWTPRVPTIRCCYIDQTNVWSTKYLLLHKIWQPPNKVGGLSQSSDLCNKVPERARTMKKPIYARWRHDGAANVSSSEKEIEEERNSCGIREREGRRHRLGR